MGDNHIQAAKAERYIQEFYPFYMKNQGRVTTYSHSVTVGDASYTDSAAAATALATGYKTHNGVVGLNSDYQRVKNVRELARERGANTAVLTTDKITGTTPAAFMAHCASRNDTDDIKAQINALLSSGSLQIAQGELDDSLKTKTATTLAKISSKNARFFCDDRRGVYR